MNSVIALPTPDDRFADLPDFPFRPTMWMIFPGMGTPRSGQSFTAIGAKGPDVETMQTLRKQIRGCPEPLILHNAGHFYRSGAARL